LATLAESAARIGEFHAHLVLAERQEARSLHIVIINPGDVVAVLELAAFRIQAPASDIRAP
jgi:hypothetical protein